MRKLFLGRNLIAFASSRYGISCFSKVTEGKVTINIYTVSKTVKTLCSLINKAVKNAKPNPDINAYRPGKSESQYCCIYMLGTIQRRLRKNIFFSFLKFITSEINE